MKVLLINDTENHYHWGCTGTSLAIKEQIQKFGFELRSITIRETKAWQDVPKTKKEFESESVFSKFCVSNPKLIEQIKEYRGQVRTTNIRNRTKISAELSSSKNGQRGAFVYVLLLTNLRKSSV